MKKLLLHTVLGLLMLYITSSKSFSQNTYYMCSTDTITDGAGTLFDSGGPNGNYQNNENCSVLIAPASSGVIILTFQSIALETIFDSLFVYDGQNTSAPLLLRATNHVNPLTVAGTSGSLYIVWHSDMSVTDSGFACTWSSISCPCGPVSGRVYSDNNSNCMYDSGEELKNIPLMLDDGAQLVLWTTSDSSGNYSFHVPVGSQYNIHVNGGNGFNGRYSPSCPSTGLISVSTVPSSGNDFGLNCNPGYDLKGNISGWGFRPGFVASVCVNVTNKRCNTPSGQIELVFDSLLTPLPDTAGIGYSVNGNTVTLPINSPDLTWSFCIPVQVSVSTQIGSSVCINMNLQPVIADSVPADNYGHFCFPVFGSFDPNDKYVSPAGTGSMGFVAPNAALTYTVRFQNTGNAEATNVYILDQLDGNLDPASIEVLAASHEMHWSLLPGNVLRFDFDNINLIDSNANEPASHGFVTYRINMINNISNNAEIQNTASIYFDFNAPVVTNTTLNTVDMFLSSKDIIGNSSLIGMYPSPANSSCSLSFKDSHSRVIKVCEMTGKKLLEFNTNASNFVLSTEKIPAGVYLIQISEENRPGTAYKMLVSH